MHSSRRRKRWPPHSPNVLDREQAVAAAKDALAAAKADVAAKTIAARHDDVGAQRSLGERFYDRLAQAADARAVVLDRVPRHRRLRSLLAGRSRGARQEAKPLTEEQKKDPKQIEARDIELEQRTYDKLKANIATFVAFYGAAAGQPQGDFFATADQALFAANGGSINSWVAPAAGNVTERIAKQQDPNVRCRGSLSQRLHADADGRRACGGGELSQRPHEGQTGSRPGTGLGTVELGRISIQSLTDCLTDWRPSR